MSNVTTSGVGVTAQGPPSYPQVVDQLDLALMATDAEGVVTMWNSRAEADFGWSREEAVGRHIVDLTVPPQHRRMADEILAALRRGAPWHGSLKLRRKDGSTFTAFIRDTPILEDGRMVGVVGVSIEIADPDLASAVRAVVDGRRIDGRKPRTLSPREREVLGMLARGLTGEQIAERLVLSPETIRTHIRNAREKLGANTRVEAVTMALMTREIDV